MVRLRNVKWIYIIAAVVSILLAVDGCWRATVVNADGICYLQSALAFGQSGLHAAMQVCGQAQWPFYSALIYAVAALTKLSYIHAAFVLNGFLSLISVLTFIYLVHLLGGTRQTLWFAAATILLMHQFNSVREYVIRDHGFWAFYLISVASLIHYLRTPMWRYALLWSTTLLLATLFRIEGIIFLALVPLVAVAAPKHTRLRTYLQLNALTALIVISVLLMPHVHLNRFSEIQFQLQHGFSVLTQHFQEKKALLAHDILNGYSARDAGLIFVLTLLVWYASAVVTNLSLVYTGLLSWAAWRKKLTFDKSAYIVLAAYVIINIAITALFLTEYLFLTKRYLIALTLLFALGVPFALTALWQQQRPRLFTGLTLVLVASAAGGIVDFGYSKKYIRDAGLWLAANTPESATLYSDDLQVMFYSQHFGNDIFAKAHTYSAMQTLPLQQLKQFDYIVLHVNPRDVATLSKQQAIKAAPLKIFANKRGDAIVIYKAGEIM